MLSRRSADVERVVDADLDARQIRVRLARVRASDVPSFRLDAVALVRLVLTHLGRDPGLGQSEALRFPVRLDAQSLAQLVNEGLVIRVATQLVKLIDDRAEGGIDLGFRREDRVI